MNEETMDDKTPQRSNWAPRTPLQTGNELIWHPSYIFC